MMLLTPALRFPAVRILKVAYPDESLPDVDKGLAAFGISLSILNI